MKIQRYSFQLIFILFITVINCGKDAPTIIGFETEKTKTALLKIDPPLNSTLLITDTIKASLHIELKDAFNFNSFNDIKVYLEFQPDTIDPYGFYDPILDYSVQLSSAVDTLEINCPVSTLFNKEIKSHPLVFRFGLTAYYECEKVCFNILTLTGDYKYETIQPVNLEKGF